MTGPSTGGAFLAMCFQGAFNFALERFKQAAFAAFATGMYLPPTQPEKVEQTARLLECPSIRSSDAVQWESFPSS
jgi:hypothetical protein